MSERTEFVLFEVVATATKSEVGLMRMKLSRHSSPPYFARLNIPYPSSPSSSMRLAHGARIRISEYGVERHSPESFAKPSII
jgi:hypothetical protein